jgi:CRP-like cAMP-binding protein
MAGSEVDMHIDTRATLAANPFFAEVLGDDHIALLARRALAEDRPAGTELIREDESGSSLFIVVSGEVEVIAGDGGHGTPIARLGPGEVFGEMSLMTGAHRSATVRATTDVRVLEVTKMALAPILDASPELVDRFAAMLKTRQAELDRVYGHRSFTLLDQGGLADMIRGFFGRAL